MWATVWQLGVVVMTISTPGGMTPEHCDLVRTAIIEDLNSDNVIVGSYGVTDVEGIIVTCEKTELAMGYSNNA